MVQRCADCRDGEHDNYDDDVLMIIVRDLGTGEVVKRSYMCESHREQYLMDGYDVRVLFAGRYREA